MANRIEIKSNRFKALKGAARKHAAKAVRKTAFDVAAAAKEQLYEGHGVDTGAMREGIYVITSDGSTYDKAVDDAKALNSDVPTLSQVSAPVSDLQAIISNVTEYAAHQEFGTAKVPALGFMSQAANDVRPAFLKALRQLEDALD